MPWSARHPSPVPRCLEIIPIGYRQPEPHHIFAQVPLSGRARREDSPVSVPALLLCRLLCPEEPHSFAFLAPYAFGQKPETKSQRIEEKSGAG